jgi:hypothetical protein
MAEPSTRPACGAGPRRRVSAVSAIALHDQPRHLLVLGEPVEVSLREDPTSIEVHLEDAPAGGHERDVDPGERGAELGGQTVRLRRVVSLRAVLDADVHGGAGRGGSYGGEGAGVRRRRRRPLGPNSGSGAPVTGTFAADARVRSW